MDNKHTNLWDEVYHAEQKDTSWIIVTLALLVLIIGCGLILLGGLLVASQWPV